MPTHGFRLIVAHEVSNVGSDRSQLANTAKAAKEAIGTETLEAVAEDRKSVV